MRMDEFVERIDALVMFMRALNERTHEHNERGRAEKLSGGRVK